MTARPSVFHIPAEKVETHAFGVDPTDNSVYVGDEPIKGEYRIQKFTAAGAFLASVSLKPAHPIALEGIAVDPAKERIYALAITLRSNAASIDRAKRAARGRGASSSASGGWCAGTRCLLSLLLPAEVASSTRSSRRSQAA
jgi:hypothetical protein